MIYRVVINFHRADIVALVELLTILRLRWIKRILHAYSCFIEFIKRVEEEIKRFAEHFYLFFDFNQFINSGERILDFIYHMTFESLKNRFLA